MTDWAASPHEIIRKNAHAISQVEEIMRELSTFESKSCIDALHKGDITLAAYWADVAEEDAIAREDEDAEEAANWVTVELNDNLKE